MNFEFRTWNRFVGWLLYKLGRTPCGSTSIADEPTAGYGELDEWGFWQYPAPHEYWAKFAVCDEKRGADGR